MLSMPQCLKVDVSQQAVQKFFLVGLECSAQSPTAHFIGSVFLTSVHTAQHLCEQLNQYLS